MSTIHQENVIIEVLALSNVITREGYKLFSPLGLTPAQFNVLNLLSLHPEGLTQQELAAALVVDVGGASRLITKMSKYINKSRDKGRPHAWVLTLSKRGSELHGRANVLYIESLSRLSALTPEKAEALQHALINLRGLLQPK